MMLSVLTTQSRFESSYSELSIDESCRDAVQLFEMVRELQTDFMISENDITEPLDLKMSASPAELTTGTNGQQGFEEQPRFRCLS